MGRLRAVWLRTVWLCAVWLRAVWPRMVWLSSVAMRGMTARSVSMLCGCAQCVYAMWLCTVWLRAVWQQAVWLCSVAVCSVSMPCGRAQCGSRRPPRPPACTPACTPSCTPPGDGAYPRCTARMCFWMPAAVLSTFPQFFQRHLNITFMEFWKGAGGDIKADTGRAVRGRRSGPALHPGRRRRELLSTFSAARSQFGDRGYYAFPCGLSRVLRPRFRQIRGRTPFRGAIGEESVLLLA